MTGEQAIREGARRMADYWTTVLPWIPRNDSHRADLKELTNDYRRIAGLAPLPQGA